MLPLLPPLGGRNHKELISFIKINKVGDSGYPYHRVVSKTTPTRLNRKSIGHIFMQPPRSFRALQDRHFMLPLSTRPTQGDSIAVALRALASG
ncbi:hypothetical protein EDC54_105179 [Samsonia erythrinae]|uniref:Uncharacterized protein n=1 Tax=Samsonia erythrinae TaxID=160434 RepID=A0A4R3VP08_9GAMM|nr:hypothetical protein EDC54_105179 [Samsonia erythrinae]